MKVRKKYRYDTDKYEYRFHCVDDNHFYGSMWEYAPFAGYGPGKYNAGSIDNITGCTKNDVGYAINNDEAWGFMRRLLSKGRVKFEP